MKLKYLPEFLGVILLVLAFIVFDLRGWIYVGVLAIASLIWVVITSYIGNRHF